MRHQSCHATKFRLQDSTRLILMTLMAFTLGVLPRVHATGVGAADCLMIGNTFLGLFLPSFLASSLISPNAFAANSE